MNPEYEKLFGGNIRRAREARGMTQEQVAAKLQLGGCDITRSALAKIEVGQRHVYPDEIRLLKEILSVSYNELLNRIKNPSNTLRRILSLHYSQISVLFGLRQMRQSLLLYHSDSYYAVRRAYLFRVGVGRIADKIADSFFAALQSDTIFPPSAATMPSRTPSPSL